ncbi:hypothetical protein [Corynebacterium lubricantis]|uniref:hypothetical protein n=1 Tax=Corynebacterium lubricantis TaxID=541095 RepID=UPI000368F774|nr:hypothetical protein [Corynebacterium lubricantis]
MRIAVTAIVFVLVLISGPFWFALLLRVLPFETLEFMSSIIILAVAALCAWLSWYLLRPRGARPNSASDSAKG